MLKKCYIGDIEYTLDQGWWFTSNNKLIEAKLNPLLQDDVIYDAPYGPLQPEIELSKKELEQFNLHLNATSYNDIAEIMDVSLATIKHRASIIIEKYNGIGKNMHELVVIYYKHLLKSTRSFYQEI